MKFTHALWTALALILCFNNASSTEYTLEEKVGQMLIVHFNGLEANNDSHRLIAQGHIGGFIYYNWANGLDSPNQVKKLSTGLQQQAMLTALSIPLWISVDQEGGPVSRLINGFIQFPGNRAIAKSGRPESGKEFAVAMGKELRAVGINVNLAPVVDVSTHPATSYIARRTFGDTPQQVVAYAKPVIEGYREAGVLAVMKHFPGYGDVFIDPHEDLPVVTKCLGDLEKEDLAPFVQLSSTADAVMTAHIMVPALDSKHCATLSPVIIDGLLRQKMKFEGLVFSDSLVMQGLLNNTGSIEEAAIQAIMAGNDILILGGKQLNAAQNGFELSVEDDLRIHKSIVEAVRQGRIPSDIIDKAFQRILSYKKKYGLFESPSRG